MVKLTDILWLDPTKSLTENHFFQEKTQTISFRPTQIRLSSNNHPITNNSPNISLPHFFLFSKPHSEINLGPVGTLLVNVKPKCMMSHSASPSQLDTSSKRVSQTHTKAGETSSDSDTATAGKKMHPFPHFFSFCARFAFVLCPSRLLPSFFFFQE